ncbi:MAG: hypothetical protein JSV63_00470 [Candidatus Aenigmatarchaeota archaeon]|nr:MAG: hypothetical protein JSV63_00470 [Candidatus Aenigmarchaeota archaeon]
MKGITISMEVIFLAIIITIVFLVYTMASPVIYSMQAASVFEQTQSFMLDLDEAIQEVASQGKGSRKSLHVTMGAGDLKLHEDIDTVKWTLETDSMIVSPRSMQRIGNLVVGSNLDVRAYENQSLSAYVLENQHLIIYLKKIGSEGSPAAYNTSEILLDIYNKDLGIWLDLERLEISIDNNPQSASGTGYTEIVTKGNALARGQVKAHMNTDYVFLNNYTVTFTLESGADFMIIEGEEQF